MNRLTRSPTMGLSRRLPSCNRPAARTNLDSTTVQRLLLARRNFVTTTAAAFDCLRERDQRYMELLLILEEIDDSEMRLAYPCKLSLVATTETRFARAPHCGGCSLP
jgi:hypothetical protein